MSELRVLAFGAWDRGPGYPRGDALLLALRVAGAEVEECRIELPFAGTSKQRLLRSPWLWLGYWFALRSARRRAQRLLSEAVEQHRPDIVLVPYPGHLVVHWVRSVFRGPVILDLFLSAFDTVVVDRRLCRPNSLFGRFLRRMDRRACEAADRVLVDTPANVTFTAQLVGSPVDRFAAVAVSDPNEAPASPPFEPPVPGRPLELLFFGTGVPLHGLEHLLAAVARTDGVRLTLIGGGAEDRERARSMSSVRVLDEFVPTAELRRHLAATHLVAGVFGTSPKADRVIPFKVMQAFAAGRPVLTGRTRAVCQVCREGVDILLAAPGDPAAIAAVLQRLVADPGGLGTMAEAARSLYDERFSLATTGRVLRAIGASLVTPADPITSPAPELVGAP